MAKTISNDAIWEKLSEIDEKLEKIVLKQKSFSPKQEEEGDEPPSDKIEDEIITQIKADIRILGLSNDSHFEANLKNITTLNNNVLSIKKLINNLSAPENINMNEIKALLDKKDILRFGFIRFSKTSFIITILGILIFTLTVFSMKLYCDSLIYQNNYYRQITATRSLQMKNDSLRVKIIPVTSKKK